MSEVQPPSSVTPPSPPAALPRVTITTAPPPLADLPLGAKLDVIISEIIDATQIKVSSKLGEIALKLPAQATLKTGDALILQLLTRGTSPSAQLTTPEGRVIAAGGHGLPDTQTAATSSSPATSQPTGPAPLQVVPGAIVTASLLRPISVNTAFAVQSYTQALTQPSATPSTATAQTGPGLSGPAQTSQSTASPGGAAASGTPTAQAANQSGVTTIPAGSGLEIRIVSINIPSSTPESFTPSPLQGQVSLAPGATVSSIVSGRQGVGQTVIQTHAGPISLPTVQAMPLGAEIKFEIISLRPLTPVSTQHTALHGTAPILDGSWFTFDEALNVLQEAAPGAHQHVIHTALPRADAQLATNVLFFLSALRGGDIKSWLGDGAMRILDRMRPDIAGQLRTDMTQMTRTFDDPLSGEWRLHGVPFLFGAEIDRIQLLIRDQENDDDDDATDKGGTRFVVDLNLTRLGHLQIDGLVGENNKRLDLVLRTDEPLTPQMREDIRRLYNDALELTGLDGSVGFQAAPGNFVGIPKRRADANPNSMVI